MTLLCGRHLDSPAVGVDPINSPNRLIVKPVSIAEQKENGHCLVFDLNTRNYSLVILRV